MTNHSFAKLAVIFPDCGGSLKCSAHLAKGLKVEGVAVRISAPATADKTLLEQGGDAIQGQVSTARPVVSNAWMSGERREID